MNIWTETVIRKARSREKSVKREWLPRQSSRNWSIRNGRKVGLSSPFKNGLFTLILSVLGSLGEEMAG